MTKTIPLLGILIPSNNRRDLLEVQVSRLLADLDSCGEASYQVVISETSSVHAEPSSLIRDISDTKDFVEYHFRPLPFSTAEEHILQRYPLIRSHYCWILSDDDEPYPDTVKSLESLLSSKRFSYLVFDSYTQDIDGKDNQARCKFPQGLTPFSMKDFAVSHGFWHVMAAVSVCIFKADPRFSEFLRTYLEICPIYSHVAAFIEMFMDEEACSVGSPLVWYHKNPYDDIKVASEENPLSNWEKFAHRHGCAFRYPWTLGFTSMLEKLVSINALSFTDIRLVSDRNFEREFVWHVQALWQILDQCTFDVVKRVGSNPTPPSLLHDSIRRQTNLSWDSFTGFWCSVLPDKEIAADLASCLLAYRDVVACQELLCNQDASGIFSSIIKSRMDKKANEFSRLSSRIDRDYVSKWHWEIEEFRKFF
jgi:hypothetical protein